MLITNICNQADFSNSIIPTGKVMLFTTEGDDGAPVLMYKDADGNVGPISGGGSVAVILGQVNADGNFQPLAFNGTTASNSGNPETVENYYGFNGVLPVPDSGGGGSGMAFYKCASVDTANKTWTGYKAVLTDGVYSFEETVTEGLTYGAAYTPKANGIFSADATIQVTKLWDGVIIPSDGLVFYAPLDNSSATAETGQSITEQGMQFTTWKGIPCGYFNGGNITFTPNGLPSGDSDRTVSCWAYILSQGNRPILVVYGGDGDNSAYVMEVEGGRLSAGGHGGGTNVWGDTSIQREKWLHLAIVHSNGYEYFYVDGIADGTSEMHRDTQLNQASIGAEYASSDRLYGYMAGVRIYDRALSADEIALLANEFTPTV